MQQFVTYNALVGLILEQRRKKAGVDQLSLAKKVGLSQPVLSRLEKGKAAISIDQFFLICKALAVPPQDIIKEAYEKVDALQCSGNVELTSTKAADNSGSMLAGAALGAVLTYILTKK